MTWAALLANACLVTEESWTVIACAVEDDQVVFLDADIERRDGRVVIASVGKPDAMLRDDFTHGNPHDDQHDFDLTALTQEIARRAAQLDRDVHFVAISTFGTVNVDSGNVEFYPHSDDVIKRRGKRIEKCLPEEVRRSMPDMLPLIDVIVDNDATASAVGEHAFGAGRGYGEISYVWAGRGINVGLVLNGAPWEGRLHPEAGHMLPRRHESEPDARGGCINHEGCMIGLASLPSVFRRRADGIGDDRILELIAFYYSQLCMSVTLVAAPARIVIGGLMLREFPNLLDHVREQFADLIGSYPRYPQQGGARFIQPSKLSQNAAVLGMIEMTRQKIEHHLYAEAN